MASAEPGLPADLPRVPPPPDTVMLNPGPVNTHPDVRKTLTYPDVCHREPEIAELMDAVRRKVVRICGGGDEHASVLLAGSGTAALEAAFSSVVPADGKVLVLDNGNYGERIARIVATHGIAHDRVEYGWTAPIDVDDVARRLAADPAITHVGLVHHETSTGMRNPLRAIGEVVAAHGRSLIVDAISSLGSEELDLEADHIDWCVGTANKCLEGLPGASFVCGRRAGFEALADAPTRTFYLDLHAHHVAQNEAGAPLLTPPVQILYALDAALDRSLAEGVAGRAARYQGLAERLRAGLGRLGLAFLLPPEQRANSVTNVHVPDGITYQELHDELKERGFVVYACQPQLGEVFRIATMGQLAPADLDRFLDELTEVLARRGLAPAAGGAAAGGSRELRETGDGTSDVGN